jgi:uracil-DNA glycosylase
MVDVDLWYGTSGPHDADIVIVGESWGVEEDVAKRPFVGSSGTELNRMLAEAGIDRDRCLMTNVVAHRPVGNEMWRLFHAKDSVEGRDNVGGLHPTLFVISEVRRLYDQIGTNPRRKLVIAVGNWSLWALSDHTKPKRLRESNNRRIPVELQPLAPTGIGNWRGSMSYMLHDRFGNASVSTIPLLPIIHPAAIMRDWTQRAVTVHDLKARVPMALKGDWRPQPPPVFWAPPTFDQAVSRLRFWLNAANAGKVYDLVCDIETSKTHITVVGLTDSTHFGMAIPFVRKVPSGLDSYWDYSSECTIVNLIRRILLHPNIKIIGQNFIYDTQYFQWWLGATPRLDFDTMLAQNLLFPGTPKGLDYLSSLYCRYHWYWKDDGKEWDTKGDLKQLLEYNCIDLIRTFEVAQSQRQLIASMEQTEQWEIKKYQYDLSLRMMDRGVKVDTARRLQLTIDLSTVVSQLAERLEYIIPQSMINPDPKVAKWYRSDKQMKYVFYDLLGFHIVNNRKTGNATVGKEALKTLRKRYPIWTRLFDLLDDYGSADNMSVVLRMQLDSDGRVRCSYNPAGTETHRLSSSQNVRGGGTNLQNLTKGDEE